MKVKGTGLISTVQFVLSEFGEEACERWLSALTEETASTLRFPLASSWYPLEEMHVKPGRVLCEVFYSDDLIRGARRWGTFNAKRELTGIYKLFLKNRISKYDDLPVDKYLETLLLQW